MCVMALSKIIGFEYKFRKHLEMLSKFVVYTEKPRVGTLVYLKIIFTVKIFAVIYRSKLRSIITMKFADFT